jgi:hypothetical protein
MKWIKKLFTNWQYEHNVATTKALVEIAKLIVETNKRLDRLEKFAKQSENYYKMIEARRQSDLDNRVI